MKNKFDLSLTKTIIVVFWFVLILMGCEPKKQSSFFTKINLKIPIDGVKNIKDCAKWYVDFSIIKRAVIYKDRIICCGWNGGFACLNVYNFRRDVVLENKMNTDLYTNIAVFQDTLFTEKFDKLYYWNSDTWVEYMNPLPIRYFDILYEDDTYVIQPYSMGEWGSIIFVYNKKTQLTKGESTCFPNSILKTDSGFYFGLESECLAVAYTIKDLEKLKVAPDSMRLMERVVDDRLGWYFYPKSEEEFKKNRIPFDFYYQNNRIKSLTRDWPLCNFISTFNHNGKMYHIIQNRFEKTNWKEKERYVGTVVDDTLRILDTLKGFGVGMTYHFGNNTIMIEDDFYGNDFLLIRNDTIFKINFITYHPNYHGKQIGDFCYPPKELKKLTHDIEYKSNIDETNDWQAKKGQPEREIEFVFNNKYKIIGHEGNGVDGNYIEIDNKRNKLQFLSKRSLLYNIFVYDNRLFLNFARNIGIIELTNIKRFVDIYKESPYLKNEK